MARGKFLTEYEKETIRIGLAYGIPVRKIAAFLKRTDRAIYRHKELMEASGVIEDLPFDFVAEHIAQAIREHGGQP